MHLASSIVQTNFISLLKELIMTTDLLYFNVLMSKKEKLVKGVKKKFMQNKLKFFKYK